MTIPLSIGLIALAVTLFVHTAGFSFWLGRISQRVGTLEKGADGDKELTKTVVELTVKMAHVESMLDKMSASMDGVQRQLANLSMGRLGRGMEFPAE